ncbi:MAG TPA: hypothetical protein VEA80_05000 [Vitreimonas sp.]|uniref:hypothetical protein n=1 Tax=Vitreimonas sp. TaxID=3069702 RepID=UPI002D446DB3|nr:hypothetical protein [Vitreimonas sp.]HYD86810.1 hypothetical protein [Vitreimonas sp.]
MAAPAGKVPIFESAGHAVRFLREHWRAIALIAAVCALAQTAAFVVLGMTLPFLLLVFFISACAHAAFIGRALGGESGKPAAILRDGARVFTAMAAVGFFITIVAFMVFYITMAVLIAPYDAQVKAAGQDQAALGRIFSEAVQAQPATLSWMLLLGGVLLLLLTSRFYLAAPASVDCKRIVVFDSWRWTKGNMLRIAAARLVVLGPAYALVFALQTLASAGIGIAVTDPVQFGALIAAEPLRFAAFYLMAGFIQFVFYAALEAGLATYLYRGLRPTDPRRPPA